LAIAKEKNVKHYSLEHGHTHYFKNNYALFSHPMVDKYISYGWKDSFISNLIPTGMWRLNPDKKYDGKTHESNVLFVCYGNVFLYDTDFLACHYINNSAQENYYNNIKTLMESISQNYAKQITYKEYPKFRGKDRGFNNEYNHIFKNCKILTNEQELGYGNLKFIDTCKLVIVGNIGTVFFETLYHGAPTIALYSKDHAFVEKQYIDLFQQLEEVGILQTCPYKMAKLIENVIDDPIVWWNSEKVIYARNNFIDKYSSPRDKFYNFLDEL
jgi:putative transferase (TIGR04331 family)